MILDIIIISYILLSFIVNINIFANTDNIVTSFLILLLLTVIGCIPIRGRFYSSLSNFYLWFIALSLTSVLTLTHIRMYGHDTNGWILPARTWFVAMLRQGDIPFWFGVGRYGFPSSVAQFSGTFWSPVTIFLALFGDYSALSIAYEFFLWRVVALVGMYWFARTHLNDRYSAVIVSAVFIGSGMFASQDGQLVIYSGMAMVPWVMGGIDRCIQGTSKKAKFFGSGVIGVSSGILAWSGYPGIWIMLPFLLLPYIIINIYYQYLIQKAVITSIAIIIGIILGLVFYNPVLFESAQFPVFGERLRDQIDPNLGALNPWGLVGFILANPTYILENPNYGANAWLVTIYPGLLPVIIIIIYSINAIYYNISNLRDIISEPLYFPKHITSRFIFLLFLLSLLLLTIEQNINKDIYLASVIYNCNSFLRCIILLLITYNSSMQKLKLNLLLTDSIIFGITSLLSAIYTVEYLYLLLILVILLIQIISRFLCIHQNKKSAAYLVSVAWIIFWSTEGGVQNFARLYLIPLMFLRWHAIHMYLADLFIIVFGWKIILENTSIKHGIINTIYFRKYLIYKGSIVSAVLLSISYQYFYKNNELGRSDLFGGVPLLFTFIYLNLFFLLVYYDILFKTIIKNIYITYTLIMIFTTSNIYIYAYLNLSNPPAWWDSLIMIKYESKFIIDLIHLLIIMSCTFVIIIKNNNKKLELLGLIGVLDTSIASARYLGDQGNMNAGGSRTLSATAFEQVTDNFRLPAAPGHPFWLGTVSPHLWVYPGSVPKVAALDARLGAPTVFREFAIFPPAWTNIEGYDIDIINKIDSSDIDNYKCIIKDRYAPIVEMNKFLSSRIEVVVRSSCSRLLVWTDSWSPGWTVQVNGNTAQVFRINNAIRGVMIDAGSTELHWRYLPPYWFVSYPLMLVGFAVACGLIVIGWRE